MWRRPPSVYGMVVILRVGWLVRAALVLVGAAGWCGWPLAGWCGYCRCAAEAAVAAAAAVVVYARGGGEEGGGARDRIYIYIYMTVMKVLLKMMCGVFHISANKEKSGLT